MVRSSKIALVVPSIRKDSFERFVSEWRPTGLFNRVDLILMEDNPTRTFDVTLDMLNHAENVTHLCWEDIDRYEWSWIIPRRSDTVRSFAYWYAWKEGYEFIGTMDDDCYPTQEQRDGVTWDGVHLGALEMRSKWYNTLTSVTPRGIPYYNTGSRPVYVNHGIWAGVLDYDAPHQLVDPQPEIYDGSNRIVPHGTYFPMCGMNVMWRREATVLMYHLLMGQAKETKFTEPVTMVMDYVADHSKPLKKLPFDRFGDIWCGILMKKVADHLGWAISTGTPYIHHDRASNPFTNLRKEANGIEVNEWFWENIDQVELAWDSPELCYAQLGLAIDQFGGEHAGYWTDLSAAIATWVSLFTEHVPDDDIPF